MKKVIRDTMSEWFDRNYGSWSFDKTVEMSEYDYDDLENNLIEAVLEHLNKGDGEDYESGVDEIEEEDSSGDDGSNGEEN